MLENQKWEKEKLKLLDCEKLVLITIIYKKPIIYASYPWA